MIKKLWDALQIREAKHRLQKDILSLLEEYEEDYGFKVTDIKINTINRGLDENYKSAFDYLDVEVRLSL
jgi:hypothetical protein